ncbi:MAG: chromosomal replication initiator protein DnaA, partial [Actinobacteria bacterium]
MTQNTKKLKTLWEKTLEVVQEQINTPTFETWFKNTAPLQVENGLILIATPSSFAKEWLESRHQQLLEASLEQVAGRHFKIKLVVDNNSRGASKDALVAEAPKESSVDSRRARVDFSLNEKYSFDSFVIGGSNRFAHAAALAVAESPAKAYNPLFIYGGVGLGKTHLLQAIASYVLSNYTDQKVKYVS